jgi:hypothetical protein
LVTTTTMRSPAARLADDPAVCRNNDRRNEAHSLPLRLQNLAGYGSRLNQPAWSQPRQTDATSSPVRCRRRCVGLPTCPAIGNPRREVLPSRKPLALTDCRAGLSRRSPWQGYFLRPAPPVSTVSWLDGLDNGWILEGRFLHTTIIVHTPCPATNRNV